MNGSVLQYHHYDTLNSNSFLLKYYFPHGMGFSVEKTMMLRP